MFLTVNFMRQNQIVISGFFCFVLCILKTFAKILVAYRISLLKKGVS